MNIFSIHPYAFRMVFAAAMILAADVCIVGSANAAEDQSGHVLDGPTAAERLRSRIQITAIQAAQLFQMQCSALTLMAARAEGQ